MNTVSKIKFDERQNLCMEIDSIKLKIHELDEVVGNDGYERLLSAISQQRWYGLKNKREIVFDSYTGILFPNFEYIPHIIVNDWPKEQKQFELNGIGRKKWLTFTDYKLDYKNPCECGDKALDFDFPLNKRGETRVDINIEYTRSYYRGFRDFYKDGTLLLEECFSGYSDCLKGWCVLPALKVLDKPELHPTYIRLTKLEKAEIIFNFFVENDWIPNFETFIERSKTISNNNSIFGWAEKVIWEDEEDYQERIEEPQKKCDVYNQIFDAYYQRIQLQKKLADFELRLAELPEPEPKNIFTSDFNYQIELKNYDSQNINQSVWKYSQASQQWIGNLLSNIDEWENEHLNLVKHTVELNQELDKKLPISSNITSEEKQLLDAQLKNLKEHLDLGLTPLRVNLLNLLSESQQLSSNLEQTNSLESLAQLENKTRPSFELLAEHTAMLCTKTLKEMEWLDQSLDFVKSVVGTLRKATEDYFILVDKYQQDLGQIGLDNSIEQEEVEKWFAEWRSERLSLLKQIQSLLDAGLNKVIEEQTVLDVVRCIEQYQNELDQFYLQKRLGIHTTYAFQANGHRQEKLEKEQELTKLVHQFMQQLEKVIFNTKTTAQKIWLIRFSDVWQNGVVNQITDFLTKEQLIERDDVVQIMSEELRKVQQQNLAACLQDAQSYSEALAQREKDVNTLIFKMRKALQK